MAKPPRFAARVLAILFAMTFVPLAIVPAPAGPSPYLSALSDLAAPAVLAAKPPCTDTRCYREPFINHYYCDVGSGTNCRTTNTGCATHNC